LEYCHLFQDTLNVYANIVTCGTVTPAPAGVGLNLDSEG